ncbi:MULTISPECIES: hypothetical protein [unclassified Streptomyces]|uniref:hypothetical protein n=1 Tax=unclassified Streptomyces TaxID=2593676 RepID=UPI00332218C6
MADHDTNAQPAELTEVQLEALIDAGNGARNDYYHERACSCSEWPEGCATDPDYANGYWDSDTFAISAAAVVGAWESMRAPAEADELALLRARLAELEALKPAPIQDCRKCGAGYDYGRPCSNCAFQAAMATLTGRPEAGQ